MNGFDRDTIGDANGPADGRSGWQTSRARGRVQVPAPLRPTTRVRRPCTSMTSAPFRMMCPPGRKAVADRWR